MATNFAENCILDNMNPTKDDLNQKLEDKLYLSKLKR